MAHVVVIGGGITGLASAYELEKQAIPYTLIEVKKRLGGSIESVRCNDFLFDSAEMCHTLDDRAWMTDYLASIGLSDGYFFDDDRLVFQHGAGALVEALSAKINAPIMHRMAVSTLGMLDKDRFGICMENGLLLDAKAVIVTASAKHAERLFYPLTPPISHLLLDYRYDTITRLSVGYKHASQVAMVIPEDSPISSVQLIAHGERLPIGGCMAQVALRMAEHDLPQDPIGEVAMAMGWNINPDADHIATWETSDPCMWRDATHIQTMNTIQGLLPNGVALAGSDYIPTNRPPCLDERLRMGIASAQKIASYLQNQR
ncbi:MAG: FAD-dependent oxidoreductase [bacterium]|nr:FAD-dependent oxidoreductase [bacterium]